MVADEASMVETAGRMQADLATLDLSLSPDRGPDMLRRLRARFPDLGLISISVGDESALARAALVAGADGVVTKGAIADDLIAIVDAVLAGRAAPYPADGR